LSKKNFIPSPDLSLLLTKRVLKLYKSKVVGGRTSSGLASFFAGASSSPSSSFLATTLAAAFFSSFGGNVGLIDFYASLMFPSLLTTCGNLMNFSNHVVTLTIAFLKPGSKTIWKAKVRRVPIEISAAVIPLPTKKSFPYRWVLITPKLVLKFLSASLYVSTSTGPHPKVAL